MNQLNQNLSQLITANISALAQSVDERMDSQEDHSTDITSHAHEESLPDATNHLASLNEAITVDSTLLFMDYISWCNKVVIGSKFSAGVVEKYLIVIQDVLHQQLDLNPELGLLLDRFISSGLMSLRQPSHSSPNFITGKLPLDGLAQNYLQALLAGDRQSACQLITNASSSGINLKDIYLQVLQPVQYQIGNLWLNNKVSIAQEHFCTFVTQLIMSDLTRPGKTPRVNHTLVSACIGGELHEIGMRMVTDFFELSGWDTYYLGSNTPPDKVIKTITEHRADVLAISATLTMHLSGVSDLITKVRACESCQGVKILVGGYPFNVSDTLWQSINADGYGRDAEYALAVANQLVSG